MAACTRNNLWLRVCVCVCVSVHCSWSIDTIPYTYNIMCITVFGKTELAAVCGNFSVLSSLESRRVVCLQINGLHGLFAPCIHTLLLKQYRCWDKCNCKHYWNSGDCSLNSNQCLQLYLRPTSTSHFAPHVLSYMASCANQRYWGAFERFSKYLSSESEGLRHTRWYQRGLEYHVSDWSGSTSTTIKMLHYKYMSCFSKCNYTHHFFNVASLSLKQTQSKRSVWPWSLRGSRSRSRKATNVKLFLFINVYEDII